MPSAPKHPDEARRLLTLRALDILDTPPEDDFDRLTRLACRLFRAPIAGISLVDEDRQWFKSVQGAVIRQTPRRHAYCAHTILSPEITLIPDAALDPRVHDSPLAVQPPRFRFYAGAPIVTTTGVPIGAFCVIDTVPRGWDHADDEMLLDLAALADRAIEARLTARRAAAATRAKSLFAAAMSHQVRTPLNIIQGHAELLAQGRLTPRQRAAAVEAITRHTQQFAAVSSEILDLAAIEANSIDFSLEDFDASELLEHVHSIVAPIASQRGLTLKIKWCGERPLMVHADPLRIRRVILHILTNCLQLTSSGTVTAIGYLDSSPGTSANLRFLIAGDGSDVSPDSLAAHAESAGHSPAPDVRAPSLPGLGLDVAADITRRLGGVIRRIVLADSGAATEVCFPCMPAPAPPAPARSARTISSSAPPLSRPPSTHVEQVLAGRRILVVDDFPDNLRLASMMLSRAGASVLCCENGAEALAAVRAHPQPFDAILMDMQMPVMDGREATGRIRAEGYSAPIFAFTANTTAGDRRTYLQAGCNDVLHKPIQSKVLVERLATAVRFPHAVAT
ncbi:MAG: response regulator [Phycisphaerales bacterium]